MKSLHFINSQACYFPIDVYEYMHSSKKRKVLTSQVCACMSVSELEWIIYWTN